MKTVRVVAAIILHENKIFATNVDTGSLRMAGSSPAERSSRERRPGRRLCGR